MQQYWQVILESLIDTVKVLPILFAVYYLIELIEFKIAIKIHKSTLLNGKASPFAGAVLGCVPQCGFSVVSTDLFSKGKLSVGALIAVYIATSDEALPIMIAHPKSAGWALLLVAIKLVFAIVVGYLSIGLFKLFFNKKSDETVIHEQHEQHEESEEDDEEHGGCCHHHVKTKSFDWLHPMLHCLKISAFLLIINMLFGFITEIWVGEARITMFLNQNKYLQPIFAALVGLIPNCASSVILTELFIIEKGLCFGALLTGLGVNAGLGVVMLMKHNKNIKENILIISILVISSLILGYSFIWI